MMRREAQGIPLLHTVAGMQLSPHGASPASGLRLPRACFGGVLARAWMHRADPGPRLRTCTEMQAV
jgi:hypothetical protein